MSETTATTETTETTETEQQTTAENPKSFTQEQLNALLADQKRKVLAQFSDYRDVKEKASRLDQIEQANKTEAEKAAERIAAAEASAAKVPQLVAEQLRKHLVGLHSITDEDAELFLTGTDPELILRQVDRFVARQAELTTDRKKQGNHVPREGTQTTATVSDERETARGLFGG